MAQGDRPPGSEAINRCAFGRDARVRPEARNDVLRAVV
jgi:hypothetical protein